MEMRDSSMYGARRINIVDPGSAKCVVEKRAGSGICLDQIGIAPRVHEPIGACYVASWLRNHDYEVRVVFPNSANISMEEVLEGDPDIVAFSCMTYNYPIVAEIARRIKQTPEPRRFQIRTVLGGYHALNLAQELSSATVGSVAPEEEKEFVGNSLELFDFVVCGEADWTLGDLSEYFHGHINREEIRGVIYRAGELWVNNFSRFDPNLNPVPLRTPEMMSRNRRFGLYYPAPSKQRAALFVWSRGCPRNCFWCQSNKMFPKDGSRPKVMYRDVGNIIDEVRQCQEQLGVNFGFAVDLNFYGGGLPRITHLCQELGRTGLPWYAMARADADIQIFEHMKRGGCTEVGIGVESLICQKKSGAPDIAQWRKRASDLAHTLRNIGLLSKFYYILGDWGESVEDLQAEADAICEVPCDEIRLSWMMPSPGSEQYETIRQAGGLVTEDLSKFSTDYPIIRIPSATPEELQKMRLDIYRRFYSPGRYGEQARQMVGRNPRLERSFWEFNFHLESALGQGFWD